MSLNDIQLNGRLLASLYAKSLISNGNQATNTPTLSAAEKKIGGKIEESLKPQVPFKALGNNQKKVLILVNYPQSTHLPDTQLDFLTTLLKACSLGLNDVAIVNTHQYPDIDATAVTTYFSSATVLLFGLTTQSMGFPFEIPPYQVQQFDGKTVICSGALHEIETDKTAKGKLWNGLKRIFSI
ncbi:MAG: hypothetical protein ACK5NK_10880 [Niabella sp.]